MKVVEFFKKRKNLFWFLITFFIIIFYVIVSYIELKIHSKYAIGITTESHYHEGFHKQTEYYFYYNGKKIEGSYDEPSINAEHIKVPNGKYLVLFSAKNLKKNILLVHKPVNDTINLDSLNMIGIDENDIDWTKF